MSRRSRGVTLIELMIAVSISLFAVAAVYSLFVGQTRSMRAQQDTIEVQESVRIAMDVLTRDIRNAGFALMQENFAGVRIENDCGAGGHQIGYDPGTRQYDLGAASLISGGEMLKTLPTDGSDACPGGSDRITLAFRPRLDIASPCSGGACIGIPPGFTTSVYPIMCRVDPATGVNTDCCAAMEAVCEGCSAACRVGNVCNNSGAVSLSSPAPSIMICNRDSASECVRVDVVSADCNKDAGTGNKLVDLDLRRPDGSAFPSNAAEWALVGTRDPSIDVNAVVFRSYMLRDPDDDGDTDLVYSDRTRLEDQPSAETAAWTVVAENVEDLQFAYSLTSTPTTFASRDLWNVPSTSLGCGGPGDCLGSLLAANNPPAAIRVSLIARSNVRVHPVTLLLVDESQEKGIRGALEDNIPPVDTDRAAPHGNVPGLRRRILTEVVGLRNY